MRMNEARLVEHVSTHDMLRHIALASNRDTHGTRTTCHEAVS